MNDALSKVNVLVEALEWIRRFRDRYVVIKLGGSALDDPDSVTRCLADVVFMEAVGMRPIVVHGGGKAISRAMAESGIEPRFVQGRRYTDPQTLKIATRVLTEDLCESLVDELCTLGGRAIGLHLGTQNVLLGRRLTLPDEKGNPIDLGRVGAVHDIRKDILQAVCRGGVIPVLPSIALDDQGEALNVNADTAAAAIAKLMGAEKLVFLSDVPGIFLDKNDPTTLVPHLTVQRCRELIADGTIAAGMVPKVEAALEALDVGVEKIHIIDARIPHSLLLEIYSDKGVGTEIVA
ncbi:acetylglutamate kinase [Planctomicrobium piriforme]|uniref:Acetylglutamate kinase n=1 Tax=Planctomicrobium piriforme TaxID=1576369 RepID=A0A1I3NAS5_9PLAN|nr:acetylglutamate kinase [Planctomicrobium piriforme]SFJ06247.1 acetylglutamate kinase [Planctomicrobium piriforme]